MDTSGIIIEDINISLDDTVDNFVDCTNKVLDTLAVKAINNIDVSLIDSYKLLLSTILKKIEMLNKVNSDCRDQLIDLHSSCLRPLLRLCLEGTNDFKIAAFEALIYLLPSETVLNKKLVFPNYTFGNILKSVICSEDISIFLPTIKMLLNYTDIAQNIWKALEVCCCKLSEKLSLQEINNVLLLIECTEKPKSKDSPISGPVPYFCQVSIGVISDKEIGTSIKKILDKIMLVDLPPKSQHRLMLTIYERLMPRMTKPIFLTDYFMTSLEVGGPISLLALQGIFTLIQAHNMNYPDVYRKIYSMLKVELFGSQYKSRFYYLADKFLLSTHLPEAMVAGFIKRFARLCLIAPAPDAIILLDFIVNLMIRHPGLKKLVHNPTELSYDCDPYNMEEEDPSLSQAIDSSLWEVQVLQSHVLPLVANAAMFINNPLPSVERDITDRLDSTIEEIFVKEYKKKMKNPPVSFEKPSSLLVPNVRSGLSLWSFDS